MSFYQRFYANTTRCEDKDKGQMTKLVAMQEFGSPRLLPLGERPSLGTCMNK